MAELKYPEPCEGCLKEEQKKWGKICPNCGSCYCSEAQRTGYCDTCDGSGDLRRRQVEKTWERIAFWPTIVICYIVAIIHLELISPFEYRCG